MWIVALSCRRQKWWEAQQASDQKGVWQEVKPTKKSPVMGQKDHLKHGTDYIKTKQTNKKLFIIIFPFFFLEFFFTKANIYAMMQSSPGFVFCKI